ncbi:MAG: MogA/MoaB family molybdenum cofactor biosynthesis protein [Candidatus Eisenbacteria sp.]|nr:MogA/MoaB family molybdenum cofactor biosynthesis protein [Candidatus Eisenbacteria bacterium]
MTTACSLRIHILTISDKASRGERVDGTGPALGRRLEELGWNVSGIDVVPDEREQIASELRRLAGRGDVDIVFTAGGTGLAPRDVTPDATSEVVDRIVPGIGELVRAEGLKHTPRAALSRGTAGTLGKTLIINLPGSPRGAVESVEAIASILDHAVEILRGEGSECARPGR